MHESLLSVPELKRAETAAPLHPLIASRWSPRAFDPGRPLTEAQIVPLLEAARWSSSSSNMQPWRIAWALRGEPGFEAILACLARSNAAWAHRAGALLVACAALHKPDGTPNRHAAYDLGQAMAQLTLQAAAAGLAVHQMGGFDVEAARAALRVPAGVEPYVAAAIGWPGSPTLLDESVRQREVAARQRTPLAELTFRAGWPDSDG